MSDESQVKEILEKMTKLEILNGKLTKDENVINPAIVDLEDDEIKGITLLNEISNFNEIYKNIAEKLESIKKNKGFKEEFQALIKDKIDKINSNSETEPNYIYSTNVLESQLSIYNFFHQKFMTYLQQKDPSSAKMCKLINENITKSYLPLIKIIYKLYPVIADKTQTLRVQLDDALKESRNFSSEIAGYEEKLKVVSKEKDKNIYQLKEEIQILQTKNNNLENENKILTDKLMRNAKDIINENVLSNNNSLFVGNSGLPNTNSYKRQQFRPSNNMNPKPNYNPGNDQPLVISNTTFCNNMNMLQNPPVCNRVFTIKMMKEVMNEIYNSKAEFDKKSDENKLPHETLEQHMYTYLNQKYGLKSMIIEWASNIINGIKVFSCEDSEICLFGKILRNEIEENARLIYNKLAQSVIDFLKFYLKGKYPFKSAQDINQMIKERKTGMIHEEEWRRVIGYLYEQEDAETLVNKVLEVIQKKYYKSRLDTERKLTREEIIKLSQLREELNIPFDDLIKILHEFQIKAREKYLKNLVISFKRVDKDNNGIIDEDEFINLLCNLNIFGDQIKEKLVEILTQIDPYNNKQITFSEVVNSFGQIPYNDGSFSGTLLDKICASDLSQNINITNLINEQNNMNNDPNCGFINNYNPDMNNQQ